MKGECQNGFICVKAVEHKKMTKAGIFLPSDPNDDDATSQLEVICDCKHHNYKKGDIILAPKVLPENFKYQDEKGNQVEIYFVKESDVIFKL